MVIGKSNLKCRVEFFDFETDRYVELDEIPILHSSVEIGLDKFFVRDIKFIYDFDEHINFEGHLKEVVVYLELKS